MRNYICKGRSETTSANIVEFIVEANDLIEVTQKVYKQCYEKDLTFVEIKELGKDRESNVFY